jgi:CheY-like chemotaxis protein
MIQRTVLVADDDPSILKLIELVFASEGLLVRTARNGQQAVEIAAQEPPSAVVVDLRMPILDGYGVVGFLRSTQATCDIPIVAMSADRHPRLDDKGFRVDAFLSKPFELDQLVNVVKGLIPR